MSDRRSSRSALASSLAGRLRRAKKLAGYPYPASPAVSAVMKGNRKTDTTPEVALRSALHRAGVRFYKNRPISVDQGRGIRVDIVFSGSKLAVFVDGCFWHRCPVHGVEPRRNTSYWKPKLDRNVVRDRETNQRLRKAGWTVLRIWEHDPVEIARDAVIATLRSVQSAPVN